MIGLKQVCDHCDYRHRTEKDGVGTLGPSVFDSGFKFRLKLDRVLEKNCTMYYLVRQAVKLHK